MGPWSLLASLDGPATYFSWGWLQISVPNAVVILVMLVLFVAAILIPFPKDREDGR